VLAGAVAIWTDRLLCQLGVERLNVNLKNGMLQKKGPKAQNKAWQMVKGISSKMCDL
jgi:hypothetical protein